MLHGRSRGGPLVGGKQVRWSAKVSAHIYKHIIALGHSFVVNSETEESD